MTQQLQTINSQDMPLTQVFQSFFIVPSYQREYVWQKEQVEQLLDDINTEFSNGAGSGTEYFIGSIVALGKDSQTYELIDGQQRMTTLFLILCAFRERFREMNDQDFLGIIGPQISALSVSAQMQAEHRYRVELQYEDSQGVLKLIGHGDIPGANIPKTRSVENIVTAYQTAVDFLRNEFPTSESNRQFYAYLTTQVKLIRVQTVSVAHALKVFETINDRGVGLDSMDLLKNLLFMHSEEAQFEGLKAVWKDMVDTLHKGGEKPLRFLRYLIFADYDVERLREEDIYGWLREHEQETGYKSDPIGFARKLREAAKAYVLFAKGKNIDSSANRYLENLRYLSGAAHQQLILLMAGRHLPQHVFDRLAKELENLFFAYIITREPTKTFEQTFARWCKDLRQVGTLEELEDFLQTYFTPAKQTLAARYNLAFQQMTEFSVQQYRLRYILAKLTQYVDMQAMGSSGSVAHLGHYINRDVQIEHILPQTPTQALRDAFLDAANYDSHVRKLGNLTLLEKSINASVGNGLFADKQTPYKLSAYLLTKSLGGPIRVGQHTAYERAASHLVEFSDWQAQSIDTRQDMLSKLAQHVWEMPAP